MSNKLHNLVKFNSILLNVHFLIRIKLKIMYVYKNKIKYLFTFIFPSCKRNSTLDQFTSV